jgi:hypothetical protein
MIEKLVSEQLEARAQALVNKYAGKTLIVIAGGRTVWTDFQRFTGNNWHSQWDVMAVNDVGMFYDRHLEHWYSLHGDQIPEWSVVREFHFPAAKYRHSTKGRDPSCIGWPVPTIGSGAYAAANVGLCLGYDLIVLCGAPLDDGGHFFDPPWKATNFTKEARHDRWILSRDTVWEGRVKSMSGFSREILGEP